MIKNQKYTEQTVTLSNDLYNLVQDQTMSIIRASIRSMITNDDLIDEFMLIQYDWRTLGEILDQISNDENEIDRSLIRRDFFDCLPLMTNFQYQ